MFCTFQGKNRGSIDKYSKCCKEWSFEMPRTTLYSLYLTLELATSSQYADQIRKLFENGDKTSTPKTTTKQIYHGNILHTIPVLILQPEQLFGDTTPK